MIHAALIGLAGHARTHFQQLLQAQRRGTLRLVAATDPNLEAAAELRTELDELGTEFYSDYQAMLAQWQDRLDLVIIPTGIPLHRPMCEAALNTGAHVLLEKPLAGNLKQAKAIAQAEKASGQTVTLAFQQLFLPDLWRLKTLLLRGELGKLQAIHGYALWPRDQSYYSRNQWAGSQSVAGIPVHDSPLQNALAHSVMTMLFLSGPSLKQAASTISMEAQRYRTWPIESADMEAFRALTTEGVELSFLATHACIQEKDPLIRLECENARVDWRHNATATVSFHHSADSLTFDTRQETGWASMLGQTIRRMKGLNATAATLEHGLAHARFMEELREATSIVDLLPQIPNQASRDALYRSIENETLAAFPTRQLWRNFSPNTTPTIRPTPLTQP